MSKKLPPFTLYKTLLLQRTATVDQIKQSYRQLAMKWHPDKHPQDKKEEAKEKFRQIAQAYDVLGDATKRKEYDEIDQRREKYGDNFGTGGLGSGSTGATYVFRTTSGGRNWGFEDAQSLYKRMFSEGFFQGTGFGGSGGLGSTGSFFNRANSGGTNWTSQTTPGETGPNEGTSNTSSATYNRIFNQLRNRSPNFGSNHTLFTGSSSINTGTSNGTSNGTGSGTGSGTSNGGVTTKTTSIVTRTVNGTTQTIKRITITRPDGSTQVTQQNMPDSNNGSNVHSLYSSSSSTKGGYTIRTGTSPTVITRTTSSTSSSKFPGKGVVFD